MTGGLPEDKGRVSARGQLSASLRRALRRLGYDIVRHQPGTAFSRLRSQLLLDRRVTVAVDVGASTGDYALALREQGFTGRIVSLEPLAVPFATLAHRAAADDRWRALQLAAGAVDEHLVINVSGRSDCSSFLGMDDRHRRAAPGSDYVAHEHVHVVPLDALSNAENLLTDSAFLKIDVQGYELEVIRGARAFLESVSMLESELSISPLYVGQPLVGEVITHLQDRGFALLALEHAFNDPATGEILQLNGLFARV